MASSASGRGRRRARLVSLVAVAIGAEVAGVWLRAGQLGGNVVVRCHQGHLFTTIWIPAASVKSLRLVLWRVQRCPVGRHWSLVTPVRRSDLTEKQRRLASAERDIRIP